MFDAVSSSLELYELGTRIGRLAIAGRVDLSRDDVITSLIAGTYARAAVGAHTDPAVLRRLRALLMLWYQVKAHCIDQYGADTAKQMIELQELRLKQRGFDGFGNRAA